MHTASRAGRHRPAERAPILHATDVTLRATLLVASGAALGGVARFLVSAYLPRDFPYGTMTVNAVGSFLLALLMFGGLLHGALSAEVRLLVGIGILGAFTTMSAFAFDTLALAEDGRLAGAAWNVVANPVLSIVAAYAGRAVALAVPHG